VSPHPEVDCPVEENLRVGIIADLHVARDVKLAAGVGVRVRVERLSRRVAFIRRVEVGMQLAVRAQGHRLEHISTFAPGTGGRA